MMIVDVQQLWCCHVNMDQNLGGMFPGSSCHVPVLGEIRKQVKAPPKGEHACWAKDDRTNAVSAK